MPQKHVLSLVFSLILLLSAPFASASINYNKPWAKVLTNAQGQTVYVRDLGQPVGGAYDVGISGINGYNNITQAGQGVNISRNLSLVSESGIIRGTEVGLTKPVTSVVADTLAVSASALGAAGRFMLRRAVPVVGAALLAYDVYDYLTAAGITYKDETKNFWRSVSTKRGQCGGAYSGGLPHNNDWTLETCTAATMAAGNNGRPASIQFNNPYPVWNTAGNFATIKAHYGSSGQVAEVGEFSVVQTGTVDVLATDPEIEAAIAAAPAQDLPTVARSIADDGDGTLNLSKSTPATIDGLQQHYDSLATPTTTTIYNPDGSQTVQVSSDYQRLNTSQNGSTLDDSTLTVSVADRTSNMTDDTPTSDVDKPVIPTDDDNSQPPSDPCANGACDFSPSPMPDQPDLYQQKYPGGIVGVWSAKWPQIQATQFVTGIKSMFPSFDGGGECPQWGLDMNIMPNAMYGYQTFGVSCSIWQIVGLIFLTSACFTAWRIIF